MFGFSFGRKKSLHNKPTKAAYTLPSSDLLGAASTGGTHDTDFDPLEIKAVIDLISKCRIVKTIENNREIACHVDLLNVFDYPKIKRNLLALQAAFHCKVTLTDSPLAHFALVFPKSTPETVYFADCMRMDEGRGELVATIGTDSTGDVVNLDIARCPHVLIAGQTGSGKSVLQNNIVSSLLMRYGPDTMQMILIDPKRTELTQYEGIPHLLNDVIVDAQTAAVALNYVCNIMDERYSTLSKMGMRDCGTVYSRIVIVIDEMAELMLSPFKRSIDESITRIAQLGRAAGIHLILATQRPTVNVITGLIKANIPTRIALNVASVRDSMVIIDHKGAEMLQGNGDGILKMAGTIKEEHIQAAYIDSATITRIVDHWTKQA